MGNHRHEDTGSGNHKQTSRQTKNSKQRFLTLFLLHFDDWFPTQPEACWVVREAEDSQPLQESFLLLPAEEASVRPVFFVAVFADTEPDRLVKELSALHQVPPDKVLASAETMAHLWSLYDHLQLFDLSR